MLLSTALAASLIAAAGSAIAAERQRAPQPNLCAGHGPGFQMISGTTTCVRVSGRIRGEADVRSKLSGSTDRARLNAEAPATMDARTETGDGPLRTVVQVRNRRGEPSR
jgi:Porin subfamily